MSDFPDRHEQIRLTHAEFICQIAQTCGNAERRPEFQALLASAAQSGWGKLVEALKRMATGERGPSLFSGLDEEDQVIVDAILRGIQDPSTLPDPKQRQNPALAAPGLAHMIHAAATGNAQALVLVGNMAEQMSQVGGSMAQLAGIVRPLINGERNPEPLCKGMDTQGEQLVLDILAELRKVEGHDLH
ncbi:MAG TPA: hypothetical protein DDY14_13580 [Chromatiaceae bacterium]|jgi:hypothetical protein|nr:MAG: hypothetical protein N838_10780 [Thiohalocapsa sp. PB-PSB1]QQO55780.1 MAG: hypothetical protein N838_22940 [Thiohalocapsa sp. PB-PSB1]HBG96310.1 hypothetical protein [Chromatiaceae bacterium]HCS89302.1 hypothetical protein [Chromatiaceae bacterium]